MVGCSHLLLRVAISPTRCKTSHNKAVNWIGNFQGNAATGAGTFVYTFFIPGFGSGTITGTFNGSLNGLWLSTNFSGTSDPGTGSCQEVGSFAGNRTSPSNTVSASAQAQSATSSVAIMSVPCGSDRPRRPPPVSRSVRCRGSRPPIRHGHFARTTVHVASA